MHAQILKYFTTVAELGTIREAAKRLHISASAVNRQLLILEGRIGEPLFERRRTGMRLTEAGDIVYAHCQGTLRDFARMQADLEARHGRLSGTVRILTLDSLMVQFLPDAIANFHAEHPLVKVKVLSADPGGTVSGVSRGEVDIGVGFDDPRASGVEVVERFWCPLCALMSPDHPLAHASEISLDECARHALIHQYNSSAVASVFGEDYQTFRGSAAPVVESDALNFSKALIMRGVGIGLVTPIGFLAELAEGRIVAIPVNDRRLSQLEIALVIPKNHRGTNAAGALVSHLQKEFIRFSERLRRALPFLASAASASPG